ncbi:MFS transporter [Pseudonocardia alaniniphila]|uniref:MFS transporter n=1 Tax=Pseudonocardia alaniniphila TaxID=75291 RepID=A0ABS9TRZ9_9PSEU|nr:MFS transporter [Pseudonocardia alaniniphila]MCH6171292.1 MFS transporter [Pseudonocardia alaniniphila]
MRNTDFDRIPADQLPSERRIVAAVWPTLLASAVGLLPFTVFSTFLVSIADAVGDGDAAVGTLRGLGGIGAVLAGIALAPLIGRIAPGRVAAAALVLLAVASVVGTFAWMPTVAAFCLLTGVSNALMYPALSTAAADRFGDGPAAARAATLVMTAQTLASTLAAPLIALPALWWGWRGDLVAVAVVALVLTPVMFRYGRDERPTDRGGQRPGYLATFRTLAAVPGARALLLVAFGRAGAFMGNLAFLAPLYNDRFGLSPTVFAFIWTLSGGSFFLGHLVAGRLLNTDDSDRRAHRVMMICLLTALVALFGVSFAPVLPVALLCTAVLSASHAVIAAAVVTLLVRRCGDVRGPALSLNASGMSLGLFLGTAAAGAGLAVGGYPGAAAVLGALTVLALGAALTLRPPREADVIHPGGLR